MKCMTLQFLISCLLIVFLPSFWNTFWEAQRAEEPSGDVGVRMSRDRKRLTAPGCRSGGGPLRTAASVRLSSARAAQRLESGSEGQQLRVTLP